MADKINFSQNINVSVQVGDTLYYGLFARKTDSDAVEIGRDADTDGFISSTLMEVQKWLQYQKPCTH